jgi:hypothetical protein
MLNLRDPKLILGPQRATTINTPVFETREVVSTFFDFRTQGTDFMESEWSRHYHTGITEDNEYHGPSRSAGACIAKTWHTSTLTTAIRHIDLDIELVSRNPTES